jgi:hypothetical protein
MAAKNGASTSPSANPCTLAACLRGHHATRRYAVRNSAFALPVWGLAKEALSVGAALLVSALTLPRVCEQRA